MGRHAEAQIRGGAELQSVSREIRDAVRWRSGGEEALENTARVTA